MLYYMLRYTLLEHKTLIRAVLTFDQLVGCVAITKRGALGIDRDVLHIIIQFSILYVPNCQGR